MKAVDSGGWEIWFKGVRNKCVKCLGPLAGDEFVVNKDMAYCPDCSALLHLGESKESRMFKDFQDGPEAEGGNAVQPAAIALEEDIPVES